MDRDWNQEVVATRRIKQISEVTKFIK